MLTNKEFDELVAEEKARRVVAEELHNASIEETDIGKYADAEIQRAYANGMRKILALLSYDYPRDEVEDLEDDFEEE